MDGAIRVREWSMGADAGRKLLVLAAACGSFLVLAGCASSEPPPTGGATHGAPSTPSPSGTVSSPANGSTADPDVYAVQRAAEDAFGPLPLEAYQPTVAEQYLLDSVVGQLADECMAGFGFRPTPQGSSLADLEIAHREARNRLFGTVDVEQARLTGYLPAYVVHSGARERSAQPSEAEYFVYTGERATVTVPLGDQTGSPGDVDGKPVPANGCLGEARRHVYGSNTSMAHFVLAHDLERGTWEVTQTAPEVRKADEAWQSCMAAAGFETEPMWQQRDRFAHIPESERPNDEERRRAVADATCNREANYVAVFYEALRVAEMEVIEQNVLALIEERALLDETLARANALAAGG